MEVTFVIAPHCAVGLVGGEDRKASIHSPSPSALTTLLYAVAQDTVAPGHNVYFLFQSLWPLNSADCHTGHESPESLKLLTDPQMAGRLLRKLPSWGIGKPSSRVWGIESGQQSILRQNSRSTTHPQQGRSLSWLCPLPGRVARWLPHPIWAASSHEEKLLPSRTLWDFLSHLASVLAM